MPRPLTVPLLSIALLGCAAPSPPATTTPSQGAAAPVAERIWSRVMDQAPVYRRHGQTKSLFICLRWPEAPGAQIDIGGVGVAGASEEWSSIGSVYPIERAQSVARSRCISDAAGKDCTCQELDRNGENVLAVPDRSA